MPRCYLRDRITRRHPEPQGVLRVQAFAGDAVGDAAAATKSLGLPLPQAAPSLAAGSLTTLNPCVFPLLPLVVGGWLLVALYKWLEARLVALLPEGRLRPTALF